MAEAIDRYNLGFNDMFFDKLFCVARRFWWIAVVVSIIVFSCSYFIQSNNHRYESTATIHRWYDLNSGKVINDRVAETLLNALAASNPAISNGAGFIRVQSIPGTDFLRISALAPTPEKAAETLKQSLAQLSGDETAATSMSGALNELKANYAGMLLDLDQSLGLFESQLTSAATDMSDPESAWVDEAMHKLLSPVERNVSNLRDRIQDVLNNVEEVADRRYGFDSDNVLLAPTMPSAPVPSSALTIAILAAIAAFLVTAALAIVTAAAVTTFSSRGTRRD